MKNANLGEFEGLEDGLGSVDFFGLDEFGMPAGLNPFWGGLAGAAISSGAAVGVRAFSDMDDWSEAIGGGAGVLAGALMALFRGTRAAGWTAIAVSAVSGGIRTLEKFMSAKEQAKSAVAGWGLPSVDKGYPVGQIDVQPLGISTVEPGMIPGQMSGAQPQLLGAGAAELLGAPVSGMGMHFGHTLFSR